MKKLFLTAIAVVLAVFSANAQVKIESPHPDLDIKITRCAYASGTVVVDMVITNFGAEEQITIGNAHYSDHPHIEAYDDEGNFYAKWVSDIKVGVPNVGLRSGNYGLTLPQDIPLKFRVEFSGISDYANKFALVKIPMMSRGAMSLSDKKPVIIRNIEWEK